MTKAKTKITGAALLLILSLSACSFLFSPQYELMTQPRENNSLLVTILLIFAFLGSSINM